MSRSASVTSCIAKMYEGGPVNCTSRSSGLVRPSSMGAPSQSAVDRQLDILNEKVDRLVTFQGEVLKKVDAMHRGIDNIEQGIGELKTLQELQYPSSSKRLTPVMEDKGVSLDIKAVCAEILKLIKIVHQDTSKQKAKIDGIETNMSSFETVVHFVGELFKNSKVVEFILKGAVPWKKGNLIDHETEEICVPEEKDAEPQFKFNNRGIQAAPRGPSKDMGNDKQSVDKVSKCESNSGNTNTTQAAPDVKEKCSPQITKAAMKEKESKCITGGQQSKSIPSDKKDVKDIQSRELNTDDYSINRLCDNTLTSKDKEAKRIRSALQERSNEATIPPVTEHEDGIDSTSLLQQWISDTQQKAPAKECGDATKKRDQNINISKKQAAKNLKSETLENKVSTCPQQRKEEEKSSNKNRTKIIQEQKITKQDCVMDSERPSKLFSAKQNSVKGSTSFSEQTLEQQQYQSGMENKTERDRKGAECTVKESEQKTALQNDIILKPNDLKEKETETTEPSMREPVDGTSVAETNTEPEKQSLVVVDDSPAPPAPFGHRIVSTKLQPVNTLYSVHHHELLGGGRFGQVHKCVEISTGLFLAAKIIKVKGSKDREEAKNEINVMNLLNHANLIQLYDAFETKNNLTLIMEYVDGGELFDRIVDENYHLTEMDAIVFTRQICEGVHYLHQQYILHLDLKPENILCVSNTGNQIKIIDFGLARRYKPREKLKVNFGTPEFLAPEVVNYDHVSFSTDMWSLGIITYMLLSGLSPFLGDSDTETLNNILHAKWEFDKEAFEHVSEEAKDFVLNLLVKEMSGRNSAANCLKHPWLNNLPEKAKKYKVRLRSQVLLQSYMAQRKWKKHFYVVAAANRLQRFRLQHSVMQK
ncbi:myosin light chain kinase 3 [Protopterus annectens]|uniref:myosin light chain kinase 3 n=1 Tax=Protopterus annectens TaxID=7888 RepID=UPI001CFAE241|nr:myosin light chain kinase 3 [Protopterus annectens]